MALASKDNPRTLQHVKTGAVVRCMDPGEYLANTSARGYRDITDDGDALEQATAPASSSSSSTSLTTSDTPAQNATKDTWVDYAVNHRGADRTAAEAMTKQDLVASYGSST